MLIYLVVDYADGSCYFSFSMIFFYHSGKILNTISAYIRLILVRLLVFKIMTSTRFYKVFIRYKICSSTTLHLLTFSLSDKDMEKIEEKQVMEVFSTDVEQKCKSTVFHS